MKHCLILSLLFLQSCTVNVILTSTIGDADSTDPDTTTETTASPNVSIPLTS